MTQTDDAVPISESATTGPWAELHETHSGVVMLMGQRALKFKKPVDLGFLTSRRLLGVAMPASVRWT